MGWRGCASAMGVIKLPPSCPIVIFCFVKVVSYMSVYPCRWRILIFITHSCFTCTQKNVWLTQYQWSDPEGQGQKGQCVFLLIFYKKGLSLGEQLVNWRVGCQTNLVIAKASSQRQSRCRHSWSYFWILLIRCVFNDFMHKDIYLHYVAVWQTSISMNSLINSSPVCVSLHVSCCPGYVLEKLILLSRMIRSSSIGTLFVWTQITVSHPIWEPVN